jgi:hypothetical protein
VKRLLAPLPSADPITFLAPARVVTLLVLITIFRTTRFSTSVTRAKNPSGDIATPQGLLNLAADPKPSALPDVALVPTRVVTNPELISTRLMT